MIILSPAAQYSREPCRRREARRRVAPQRAAEEGSGAAGYSQPNSSGSNGGNGGKPVAPLAAAVEEEARRSHEIAPFHFPGHKRGAGASYHLLRTAGGFALAHDLTELQSLDNLSAPRPNGPVKDALSNAAATFSAHRTWFLVNGATVGLQAAMLATCGADSCQTVAVIARNCHQAVYKGLVLADAMPAYLQPELDVAFGVAHCPSADLALDVIKSVIGGGQRIGCLVVVSPTYFGACADIPAFAKVAHAFDIPLIVDEAHGAHFGLSPSLPSSAISLGADIVVQSTHKTLSGLTQTAMLHISSESVRSGRVYPRSLASAIDLLQTSSPRSVNRAWSWLLLSSLDAATEQAAEFKKSASQSPLATVVSLAIRTRRQLASIPGIEVLGLPSGSVVDMDPLRVVVSVSALGITGTAAVEALDRRFGVVAEMATTSVMVFVFTVGNTAMDAKRLVGAVKQLATENVSAFVSPANNNGSLGQLPSCTVPQGQVMSPRKAHYSDVERIPIDSAEGRISAELLCPYPPGIPIIAPGELITGGHIEYLSSLHDAGITITGTRDPSFQTVSVIIER